MPLRVIQEDELRSCVGIDAEAMGAVSEGFTALAEGQAIVPPIICLEIPDNRGEVDIKTAHISGLDSFAVKIASGFSGNPLKGLPYSSGMMILISSETGMPTALLADNGYLTDVRTGLAGAIAAAHLAPHTVSTAGVIGSGVQARFQIHGLRLVRNFDNLLVYSRTPEKVQAYVREMSEQLDVSVEATSSVEELVERSDVVVTTTPARDPVVKSAWLHPGMHITSMGSDTPYKQELDSDCFRDADLVVCDLLSQSRVIGELRHALADGAVRPAEIIELGEVTSHAKPGRTDETEISICDLSGIGVQDTTIARFAYQRAMQRGLGTEL